MNRKPRKAESIIEKKTSLIKTEEPVVKALPTPEPEIITAPKLKKPELTAEQKNLKEIYEMFPLKPNDLNKRYMFEQWFPKYEKALGVLAATFAV